MRGVPRVQRRAVSTLVAVVAASGGGFAPGCSSAPVAASPPSATTIAAAPSASVSTPPPPPEPRPEPPADGRPTPTCTALPAQAPVDAVIVFAQHIVPIGAPIVDVRASVAVTDTIDAEARPQPWLGTPPPRQGGHAKVSRAELESLYAAFRQHRFDGMRARSVTRGSSPHYGGRYLTVLWPSHACEVGDDGSSGVAPADQADFDLLVARTTELYEAARGRGAVRPRR